MGRTSGGCLTSTNPDKKLVSVNGRKPSVK
nr:MAG TPA: hypothetical protein [Caudoviricetes sp.]